mgnify:CR=1 FL=1
MVVFQIRKPTLTNVFLKYIFQGILTHFQIILTFIPI